MTDNSGPAFPLPGERDPLTGEGITQGHPGMTLLQWYAGQALAGLAYANEGVGYERMPEHREKIISSIADTAFEIARAMLAEDAAHEENTDA